MCIIMENNNYILISLNDEKSKAVAEVLGSPTCKKIIGYLSENQEASQKDLSDALNIPMNTLEYNIKKLLNSGFIQKRKNFFWSKKGKKIIMYELSKKSIIISHKKSPSQKLRSILPAFILTAAGTIALWIFEKVKYSKESAIDHAGDSSKMLMEKSGEIFSYSSDISGGLLVFQPAHLWVWFLTGALLAILITSIINWRKL